MLFVLHLQQCIQPREWVSHTQNYTTRLDLKLQWWKQAWNENSQDHSRGWIYYVQYWPSLVVSTPEGDKKHMWNHQKDRLWWCPYAQTDAAKVQSIKLKVNTFYKHMVISECAHLFYLLYMYIQYILYITSVYIHNRWSQMCVCGCGWVWVGVGAYVSHTSPLAFLIASCTVAWICVACGKRRHLLQEVAG